jgi:outer membrane protein
MRYAIAACAAVLAAATFPVAALAQGPPPMTLTDAVSYALDHDVGVAQKHAAVTAQAHAVAVQMGQTFPTVSGQLQNYMQKSANYGGSYAVIGLAPQSVFSQNTASVSTNYTLNIGGLGLLQLASAKASLEQAREARAGVSAGVDVLRAQVAEAKSASTLVAAVAAVQNSREALAHTIGAPLDTPFAISTIIPQPTLPNGTIDTLENIALSARPDIVSARKALLSVQETRKGWIREIFPTFQITGAIGNQYSPTETGFLQEELDAQFLAENQQRIAAGLPPLPLSDEPRVPRGSPGYWQLGLTSTFTLPFIDYGQRHTERVNDDAQIASDEAALDQVISQAQVDVRQQYRAAQTALVQLSYAQEEARLGTESARIAQLQYRNGVIALTDVFQAQQTSVQAQTDLVNAQVAYVNAVVALRVGLGTYDARSAVADLR